MLDDICYYDDVLRPWINAPDPDDSSKKRKFIVRRDPRDISTLHFFDPELRRYYEIPYRDLSHPCLSVWELRAVRGRLKKDGQKAVDEAQIFAGYEQMTRIEQNATKQTKSTRRNEQRRQSRPERPAAQPSSSPSTGWDEEVRTFDDIEVLQ